MADRHLSQLLFNYSQMSLSGTVPEIGSYPFPDVPPGVYYYSFVSYGATSNGYESRCAGVYMVKYLVEDTIYRTSFSQSLGQFYSVDPVPLPTKNAMLVGETTLVPYLRLVPEPVNHYTLHAYCYKFI